jgi:glucosamine-6-phosphate deaminase
MNDNLFNHINIDKSKTFVPSGCAKDMDKECKDYDALIEKLGGIDLQLLGIGLDGHIGFNEPDEVFEKGTHVVTLDESTIEANARFFNSKDEVPTSAITMGMLPIMQAKKVLLVANGQNKKDILEKAFYGPITAMVPASMACMRLNQMEDSTPAPSASGNKATIHPAMAITIPVITASKPIKDKLPFDIRLSNQY